MNYRVFNEIIGSEITLPELSEEYTQPPTITFRLGSPRSYHDSSIEWVHHWKLKNGQISISVGKYGNLYWLLFPQIASFKIDIVQKHIVGYPLGNTPDNTIRHLLLDQVIPRLLFHLGEQVVHASCVKIGTSGIAFTGDSGWGKSTIAAYFNNRSCRILTDDCLLLRQDSFGVSAVPNYNGLRLLQDSFSTLLPNCKSTPVAHYGNKKRLIFTDTVADMFTPLKAVFILTDPILSEANDSICVEKISGAEAAIALVTHSFPLDIKNSREMGGQLRSFAKIAALEGIVIYRLTFPRRMSYLSKVFQYIQDNCLS